MPPERHATMGLGAPPLRLSEKPIIHFDAEGNCEVLTENRSAASLFSADTGMELPLDRTVYRRSLHSAVEVAAALEWQSRRHQHVFFSDELDTSIALDDLFRGQHGNFTPLGRIENLAKASGTPATYEPLAEYIASFIRSSPLYADCAVCAVPPSPEKRFDLPSQLASLVALKLGVEDKSHHVRFLRGKKPIKSVALEQKATVLANAGLQVSFTVSQSVILIDDKYQSGTTANWIGNALHLAGAASVHGLFVVKTWRGRDNLAPPGEYPD